MYPLAYRVHGVGIYPIQAHYTPLYFFLTNCGDWGTRKN